MMKRTIVAAIALLCFLAIEARERQNINLGWKFLRSEVAGAEQPNYDDTKWQSVDLPHDAAVYGEFVKQGDGASARNGYRKLGRGWYRRHLIVPAEWQGKRIVLEFEGVYRDAKVYINGQLCDGKHPNGYMDFALDITDKLRQGDNVVAVSYNNTYTKSSRWYNGEGINRDVWLEVLNPVHVARYGTYVTTPKISTDKATVAIETSVANDGKDSVLCRLVTEIVSPDGRVVATREAVAPFKGGETFTFSQRIAVPNPQLWNVGAPKLYKAVSKIFTTRYPNPSKELAAADTCETTFGIRDIEFTPDEGLLVNGKRVYVNGVCLHTDLGPLGTASFKAAWDRRLEAVTRDLGCNGLRLSHNAYPKYVLDWADSHGVLVVDEFFDKWEDSYYGQGAKFGELHLRDLRSQMMRDRNHPSVFLWSVGNETYQQIRPDYTQNGGVEMLKRLMREAKTVDPSRLTTCSQYPNRYGCVTKKRNERAFNSADPHQFEFYSDVVSTNYLERFWDEDHKKYPQLIFMEGEIAVGDLGYDYFNYDHSYPVGQFYWGGTDYIGESFGWPSKGWVRGLVDFTNRLKPLGQSVKSFYSTVPMTKIVTRPRKGQGSLVWNDLKMTWTPLEEHWNYAEGDTLDVQVMTNCDVTELLLNGQSLGRKQLPPKNKAPELVWQVPYIKGELRAVGYRNGVKVADDVVRTAGKPERIVVTIDRNSIKADGLDLAYLDYIVVDKDGNVCQDPVRLDFKVTGQGINTGVSSANMLSDEPWQGTSRTTYQGRCQLIVRSKAKAGKIKIVAKAKGLNTVTSEIAVE